MYEEILRVRGYYERGGTTLTFAGGKFRFSPPAPQVTRLRTTGASCTSSVEGCFKIAKLAGAVGPLAKYMTSPADQCC